MSRVLFSCVRAAVVLALLSTPVSAATLYVSPTGHDSNPGTLTAPLASPARALALAVAGDTVLLRGGTYSLTRPLTITQAGLTLASYPGERARIVAATTDLTNLTSVIVVYSSRVTIERLEIEGASYYGIKLDDYYGPQTGISLRGLYVHHTGRDGIKVQSADGLVIEDSEVAFSGVRDASNAEGIDIMGSVGVTVRRNYIHDSATNGIFVKAGTRQALIEANRIERSGYSGILLGSESGAEFMRDGALQEAIDSVARNNIVIDTGSSGLGSIAGDNVRFEHNTVINAARTTQAVVRVAPNSYGTTTRNVTLHNNVLALAPGSTRPMVHFYNYSGPLTSDGNIWFSPDGRYQFWREFSSGSGNYWTSLSQWRSGMNVDMNSQAVDPRLDAAALYRPLADSPALDRGVVTQVTADYAGVVRPQGIGFDIGAHERAVATATPTEPTPTEPAPAPSTGTLTAPSAPDALSVTQVSRSSAALKWSDTSTNEQGFRIERATDGRTFAVIATVGADAQAFTDTGLKTGKTYTYRVVAYNSAGVSSYSNTAAVTIRK